MRRQIKGNGYTIVYELRVGHYDFAHPQESSCLIFFSISKGAEKYHINLNLPTESEKYYCRLMEADLLEGIKEAYQQWEKHVLWSSTKKDMENLEAWLNKDGRREEIYDAIEAYKIERIDVQIRELQSEREKLSKNRIKGDYESIMEATDD